MSRGAYQISSEQADKGIRYWNSIAFKRGMQRRETTVTRSFHGVVWNVLESGIARFELVDWHCATNGWREFFYPIYSAIAEDGEHFGYVNGSWQSGMPFQFV